MDIALILCSAVSIRIESKLAVQVASDAVGVGRRVENPGLLTRPGAGPEADLSVIVQGCSLEVGP